MNIILGFLYNTFAHILNSIAHWWLRQVLHIFPLLFGLKAKLVLFTVKLNFFTKCWFSLSKFVNNIRVSFGSKLQWSIQTKYYIGAPGWSSGLMRQFLDQRGRGSGPWFESACQHYLVFKTYAFDCGIRRSWIDVIGKSGHCDKFDLLLQTMAG